MNNQNIKFIFKKSILQCTNIVLVIIFSGFMFACSNQGNGTSTVTSSQRNGGITIPSVIIATVLPTNGILSGYITVAQNGQTVGPARRLMTLDGGVASITIPGLEPGTYTFTVEFDFQANDFGGGIFMLARASQEFTLVEGDNVLPAFNDALYDTQSFDNDNDGTSNISELAAVPATNPGVPTCILDNANSTLSNCVLG